MVQHTNFCQRHFAQRKAKRVNFRRGQSVGLVDEVAAGALRASLMLVRRSGLDRGSGRCASPVAGPLADVQASFPRYEYENKRFPPIKLRPRCRWPGLCQAPA